MTQTSDDSTNDSGSNASVCKETTTFKLADHDKKTKKEKVNSISICVASSHNTVLVQQSEQMEEVAKVNEAEESTQISSSTKENPDVSGLFSGAAADTTTIENSSTTTTLSATNIVDIPVLTTRNESADATSNGTVAITEMELPVVVDTTSLMTFSKAPMCAICGEPCICYCKSCKKVSYCSKEHQKKHLKAHRPECYPVTIQVNSVFGSHLVVTRDIKRGEVILCEKPLVIAPFLNYHPIDHNFTTTSAVGSRLDDNDDKEKGTSLIYCSICLVCHKIIADHHESSSYYTCSRCGWQVCSAECEKHSTHADQECKIFAEYHVDPSTLCDKDSQFLCVALLRILQHKKGVGFSSIKTTLASTTASSKWSQFMDVVNKQVPMKDGLNSQLAEAKKTTSHISDRIRKSLGSIIYKEFSVTDAEIDQIVLTLRTSSFITDIGGNYINGFGGSSAVNNNSNLRSSSNSGNFLTVYHLASMLTSNCIPNVSWIIQQPGLDFYLRASVPIKTGERINVTFVDPLLGTRERRELLWKEKYLSCSCSRCSDPLESCFFSAIKCSGKNGGKELHATARKSGSDCCGVICECEGYVLPTDPLAVTYTTCHTYSSSSSPCCCSAPGDADKGFQEKETRGEDSLPGERICEERVFEWKCNVCLMRQPWGFVQNSLERMKRILTEEQGNVCFTTNIDIASSGGGGSSNSNKLVEESKQEDKTNCSLAPAAAPAVCNHLEILEARVDKIDSLVGNVAHANHHYILKMENEILSSISDHLEKGQVPFEEMEKWAVRMIELCKKGLKVVNVLCPGLSRERGHLLYFLQQGLTISLLFKTSRAMRVVINPTTATTDSMSSSKSVNKHNSNKEVLSQEELMKKFYEVILARKEILEIFALTKDNSRERKMLKTVQQDSIEVRLLKNYFKYHQNVSIYKI